MRLFWRKGYEATGIAELERATGLGRQSLYGAFGDKRSLFLRVVERYFERVLEPYIVDILDAPGSGRANVERIFQQWEATAVAPDFPAPPHIVMQPMRVAVPPSIANRSAVAVFDPPPPRSSLIA